MNRFEATIAAVRLVLSHQRVFVSFIALTVPATPIFGSIAAALMR